LLASLFVQRFALNKPLFFQVTVDKLLTHKVIRRYSCSSPASQSLVSSMSFSNI
jgi:hypothetical protein